ncbi:hypothetical protein [Pseudalkalibacillus berkeleyi]|uniref:Sporulation protein n=1 Tax=Pseudalkalibacillus berkeleyi TaxID=1069813 RepID=A0ABS9H554_9BACL|nr:hypothetical protein [Pseudalkalibacillus berkeleyi]MCF6138923.1 hypothetical protein [Pseudalkalibacillus berkeleyi]
MKLLHPVSVRKMRFVCGYANRTGVFMLNKAVFLSGIVLLAACSPMQPPSAEEIADKEPSAYETKGDKNPLVGHGAINFHATNRKPNRSYNYETNQNPNSYRNLTSKRFTISDDQDKIREAVKDTTGRNAQFVTINGNDAWVHVNVPKNYSKKQMKDMRKEIRDAVQLSVPRYEIHVRLDNK